MLDRIDSPDLAELAIGGTTLWLLEAMDMSEDGQTVLVRATFTDDGDGGATLHYGLWLYEVASQTYTVCFNSLLAGVNGSASNYEVTNATLSQSASGDFILLETGLRGAAPSDNRLAVYDNGALTSVDLMADVLNLPVAPRIENYALSEDGRFLAVQTDSDVLAAESWPDTNECSDIYLIDLHSATVERVSFVGGAEVYAPVTLGGLTVVGSDVKVVFTSTGAFVSGDTNASESTEDAQRDAYLWQMGFDNNGFAGTSSISLASKTSSNTASGLVTNGQTVVTAAGVFFESLSGSLVANDSNDAIDVFFRSNSGSIQRIEPPGLGELSAGATLAGASADGSRVLLLSSSPQLVGTAEIQQLIVVDMSTMNWEVISASNGNLANDWVITGNISLDGRSFTLTTAATNLDSSSPVALSGDLFVRANSAPELAQPLGPTFIDTAVNDTFAAVSGTLLATDLENDVLAYGISGGTDGGTTVSLVGNYGTLTITKNTGAWFYAPNDAAIEALNGDATDNFTVTVSDRSLASSQLFTVNLVGSYDPTVATAKYFVLAGSGANYIDYNLNAGPLGFYGQYTTQVGTTGVDAIHVRPGTAVDFTLSGASADKVYFDGNHDDYAAYLSGSIMTLVRGTGEAQEFVRVTKATNLASSDVLVFANGTVSTWDLYNLLKNGTPMPALGSETSLDPLAPAADGSTLNATVKAFSLDSTGETFAPVGHGMHLITVGSVGVDKVYVGDGSSVDATLLGASSDLIYLRGNWADYSKSLAGSVITFTRTINGELETVKVVGGTGALNDKLIFADGAVQSYNAKTALMGNLNVDIHSISGYDANTVTPIINAVRMVDGGSYLAAPDKTDAYLIDGSQVLHVTLEGFALGDVLEFANLGETLLTFDRGVPDDGATTLIAGNSTLTLIGLTSDTFTNLGEFQAVYGAEAVLFL